MIFHIIKHKASSTYYSTTKNQWCKYDKDGKYYGSHPLLSFFRAYDSKGMVLHRGLHPDKLTWAYHRNILGGVATEDGKINPGWSVYWYEGREDGGYDMFEEEPYKQCANMRDG